MGMSSPTIKTVQATVTATCVNCLRGCGVVDDAKYGSEKVTIFFCNTILCNTRMHKGETNLQD